MTEHADLRPPPRELIGVHREFLREAAQRFTGPSDRATDPNHPVGAIAAAIRQALPDFQDWPLDVGEAAAGFFTGTGEYRDRLQAVLPPGLCPSRLPASNGSVYLSGLRLRPQGDDGIDTRGAMRGKIDGHERHSSE